MSALVKFLCSRTTSDNSNRTPIKITGWVDNTSDHRKSMLEMNIIRGHVIYSTNVCLNTNSVSYHVQYLQFFSDILSTQVL